MEEGERVIDKNKCYFSFNSDERASTDSYKKPEFKINMGKAAIISLTSKGINLIKSIIFSPTSLRVLVVDQNNLRNLEGLEECCQIKHLNVNNNYINTL